MRATLAKFWKNNRTFVVFILLMAVFRSAFADWNTVPTGSMKPTIVEGDRILVNKLAYDLRLPFTHISLIALADPARGDIVVFDSEAADQRMVKRVVGLPGDIVEMRNDKLLINGEALAYSEGTAHNSHLDYRENLLGVEHRVRFTPGEDRLSSFPPIAVPADHYLVLGDNRDNSADSRVYGFIPRNEIVGRTRRVVLSFNYDNYYIPRGDRFLKVL